MFEIFWDNFLKFLLPFFIFINFLGFVSLPFTKLFFKKDSDGGYSKSLIIGLILLSWIYFGICTIGFLLNLDFIKLKSSFTLILASIFWLLINLFIYYKKQAEIIFDFKKYLSTIVILFFMLLFFYLAHAFNPRVHPQGSENFMNLGILNSIFYSQNVPVNDIWYAGQPINYYYFGHFIFSTILKFVSLTPNEAYFYLAIVTPTLFFTALLVFIKNLYLEIALKKSRFQATIAGIIGVIFTFFISPILSLYGLYELVFNLKSFRNLFETYPIYTIRIIDGVIAENYNYAFLLNPLHGHTTNLLLGIMVLGLFYNFFKEKQIFKASNPTLIFSFFLIGVMFTISSWDLVVYAGLFAFLYLNLRFYDLKNNSAEQVKTLIFLAYPVILGASFWGLYFVPSAGLPGIVKKSSDLLQFFNFWGIYLILIFYLYFHFRKTKLNDFLHSLVIYSFLILLFIEILYFSDANKFNSGYRANTYYKFSNVVILLLSIFIATYFSKFLFESKKIIHKVILSLLIIGTFWINSIYMNLKTGYLKFTGITNQEFQLKEFSENSFELFMKLKNLENPNLVIAEGTKKAYTLTNYLSVYSGIPTIIGWEHEYTWRLNRTFEDDIDMRYQDLEEIYTGDDLALTLKLLQKYNVNYLVISKSEREVYQQNLKEKKLNQIGEIVFEKGDAKLIKINNP